MLATPAGEMEAVGRGAMEAAAEEGVELRGLGAGAAGGVLIG